jgi:methylmalonyl-CoA mutase N-terminal domain/subunit
MRDRFGAKNPRSTMLRFHSQTAGSTLTAQQPDVNVVRVTLQALAAVLGGTQSLHTNSRDEALGLPTEESARLALRTQQILAHETGVTSEPDPLGGSYAIEEITGRIESEARAYLDHIDRLGGTLRALEQGYIQAEIQNAAYEYQQEIEKGDRIVVGVNRFRLQKEKPPVSFRLDPAIEEQQIARLRELKSSRQADRVKEALAALALAAQGSENLMPRIMEACAALATVGEISDCLRGVFGEYKEA